jgi:catechol 2,3-dioxygenase-like lactoylglutathione lyase family enzyme
MITTIAHVCLVVQRLDEAVAFYRDRLGLRMAFEFRKPDGTRTGVYLKAGGRAFLELFETREPIPRADGAYRHTCLEVEDLPSTVTELRRRGVAVTDPQRGMDQSWQAWFEDPEGNRFEWHQYTPDSWQGPHLA